MGIVAPTIEVVQVLAEILEIRRLLTAPAWLLDPDHTQDLITLGDGIWKGRHTAASGEVFRVRDLLYPSPSPRTEHRNLNREFGGPAWDAERLYQEQHGVGADWYTRLTKTSIDLTGRPSANHLNDNPIRTPESMSVLLRRVGFYSLETAKPLQSQLSSRGDKEATRARESQQKLLMKSCEAVAVLLVTTAANPAIGAYEISYAVAAPHLSRRHFI